MVEHESNEDELIYEKLIQAGLSLNKERELDTLLDKVVDIALSISHADACSLYVVSKGCLEFKVARNLTFEKNQETYQIKSFQLNLDSNTIAGYVAVSGEILNIEDVNELPANVPYHFDNSFDRKLNYVSRSMLAMPLQVSSGSIVGVLQLINHKQDAHITPFPDHVVSPLKVIANQSGISIRNALLADQLKLAQNETVYRLSLAAEARDQETGFHLRRMSMYSKILARAAGLDEEFQETILNAAPLHDVGKIGIPDRILQKKGKLSEDEWSIMRTHAEMGYQILKDSKAPLLEMGAQIALSHHEKYDGSGYPKGLSGEEIPLVGRITTIADVFDALTSKRYYKGAWQFDDTVEYFKQEKDKHFDGKLVDLFLNEWDSIMEVYHRYQDHSGEG